MGKTKVVLYMNKPDLTVWKGWLPSSNYSLRFRQAIDGVIYYLHKEMKNG